MGQLLLNVKSVQKDIYAFQNGNFAKSFNKRKASTDHWMSLSVGSSACNISLLQIRKNNALAVEWYISDNKELYHKFFSHRGTIESEMGTELEWYELPNKKASSIRVYKTVDYNDKEGWPQQFEWLMDMATKMKRAFRKYL